MLNICLILTIQSQQLFLQPKTPLEKELKSQWVTLQYAAPTPFKGHQLKCYSSEPVSRDMTNEFGLQGFVSFLF